MYDLIKSRQTPHTEPFIGQYLRATGNGSQFLRVHTYDPATRQGTVISAFKLDYGHLNHAKKAYVRPFTAQVSETGNWWGVHVPNKNYWGGWAYLCVDIYSVFHDVGTAYDLGQRSGKAALRGPSYRRSWDHQTPQQIQEYVGRKRQWSSPFKRDRELELAWLDGFNNATR